jgi:hypothetical protein
MSKTSNGFRGLSLLLSLAVVDLRTRVAADGRP